MMQFFPQEIDALPKCNDFLIEHDPRRVNYTKKFLVIN